MDQHDAIQKLQFSVTHPISGEFNSIAFNRSRFVSKALLVKCISIELPIL
jgi:hypothetical protein